MRRAAISSYRDPRFARREWEGMWQAVWLLAAHVSQLREAGSFVRFDLGHASMLLVRQPDGSVRAFHNVCIHRGTQLCSASQGRRKQFRCPYHGWRYGADGALLSSHDPPAFEERQAAQLGLRGLRCEERFGFYWVSLAREPEPLDEYLAEIAPLITPYQPEQWQLRSHVTTTLACNWKTSRDAHNEAVHVHALHPEVLSLMDDTKARVSVLGRHGHIAVPFGLPSERIAPEGAAMPAAFVQWASSLGVQIDTGQDRQSMLARLREAARAQAKAEGWPVETLSDAQLLDTHQLFVFPNLQLNMRAGEVLLFRHRPHLDSPEQMHFDQLSFARTSAAASRGAQRPADKLVALKRVEPSASVFGAVTGADLEMVARQQQGLRSEVLQGFELGPGEELIESSNRTLARYLGGDEAKLLSLYLQFTFDIVARDPLEHLHWGYWAELPREPRKLPQAQQAYAELLMSMIPPSHERVLDVGCGLGGLAHMLQRAGKTVHAISPRADHCALLRKAAPELSVSCARFEDLAEGEQYDLLLFAESFNFFVSDRKHSAERAVAAWLDRCRTHLAPGGQLLIADVIHKDVLAALQAAPQVDILDTRDVTDAVAFTGEALQWHIERYVLPYQQLLDGVLAQLSPILSQELKDTLSALDQQALQALFRGEMVEMGMARDHRYLMIRLSC